ncbi:MAG: hypothetical protein ACWGP1_12625 [Syntrophobacteria bacterium]|jgi:hypothetical protein
MSEVRQAAAETPKIRRFFKISLIVGFLVVLNYGGSLVVEQINFQLWPEHEHLMVTVLWVAIVVYVLWMALPFVPGIELGLALMIMLGTRGIVLVYFCTLMSLSLSFTIGRLIPLNSFARFLGWLHLYKARDLVLQLEPLNSEEKLDFLLRSAPSKIIPFLVKHRYLMIAVALNLPGNVLIGGGGGIGLISGMSRLYPFPKYILLVSLAITPLPLLLLAGKLPV